MGEAWLGGMQASDRLYYMYQTLQDAHSVLGSTEEGQEAQKQSPDQSPDSQVKA